MTDRRAPTRIVATVCALLATSAGARAQEIDPSFDPGADGTVYHLVVLPDGRIMVAGSFNRLGGGGTGTNGRDSIGRLYADGSFDPSFGNVDSSPGGPTGVLPLANGKILIAGPFVALNDGSGPTAHYSIARLNADGSIDESFDPGVDEYVGPMAEQADGKILLGGSFTRLGGGGWAATGSTRNHIGRLNANGSLDESFDPGANGGVSCLLIQPDGKILVAGSFTTIGGGGTGTTTRNRIARLNADGSLDMTFDPGANGEINALAVQPDGQILVVGRFTMLGGGTGTTARSRIGRFNADGSLDTSFNPGANNEVMTVALQADGKVVVGGYFTTLGGGTGTTPRNYFGRLNSDGSLDETFNPGANSIVETVVVQTDGLILVGGNFSKLGGGTGTTTRSRIGRVFEEALPLAPTVTAHPSNQSVKDGRTASFSAAADGYPQPAVQWQVSADGGTWSNVAGATSSPYSFTVTDADDGKWFRAVFTNGAGEAMSNAATLDVLPLVLPVITAHPTNQTATAGKTATFSAAASGCTSARWQRSTNNGSTWAGWGGDVSCNPATATVTATAASAGALFRAVFSNPDGSVTTDAASLSVISVSGSDFNGDGVTDRALYRRTTGIWDIGNGLSVQVRRAGLHSRGRGLQRRPHDRYRGVPTLTGTWYVRGQFWTQFGEPGDVPVPGDYDGNGTTDLAVYRPSTGGWYVRDQLAIVGFGGPGFVPVPADYNGDGTTDIAVYHSSGGVWYVRDQFWLSFGDPGQDTPVPGDYNGDGSADFAVYRPSTGLWQARTRTTSLFGYGLTRGSPGIFPSRETTTATGTLTSRCTDRSPVSGSWATRSRNSAVPATCPCRSPCSPSRSSTATTTVTV